ncbi:alpha/beta hydrolase [uncultured Demequina sp.]|uniref:alpha/beta hydrolase n=1 Tax=uncultured Demequina sp. TaxID=693499 RepID=UPI0025F1A83E|nr:alpha/beta hydrolase [uncultured Demequina sp.]
MDTTLTFRSRGLILAGSLRRPDAVEPASPSPTALLLAGSGDIDRDGDQKRIALGIQRLLAERLAEWGWTSLRYDKAGVGASEGDYLTTTLLEERADARAALAATVQAAHGAPVVVIGHSAGSLHAAALAAESPELVAGVVLLACPAQDGEAVLRGQAAHLEPTIPAFARALLRLMRQTVAGQQAKAIAKLRATTTPSARIGGAQVNAGWMREFLDEDPLVALRQVTVPALAITGDKDIQVEAADLPAIASAVRGPVTTAAPADVDHLLREESAEASLPQRYKHQIGKPLAASVTEPLGAWLAERAARN